MHRNVFVALLTLFVVMLSSGCVKEEERAVDTPKVAAAKTVYQGPRSGLAIGKFDNRTNLFRGLFTDNVDPLGSQAKTLLATHLQQSGRFNLMSRDNLPELSQEAKFRGETQGIQGAPYVITGDVTAFGRKEVGDKQLFGLLGRGKTQVAYAKVSLNLVDVRTSQVVYATQGAGEYTLASREIIGTGGYSTYDSTLNGKVLDLAIREAVDNLVRGMDNGEWQPKP